MHRLNFRAARAACLVVALAACVCVGCANPRTGLPAEPSTSRHGGGGDAPAGRPTLGHPTILDDNGLVVIPFALELPDDGGGGDKFSFSPNLSSGSFFYVSGSASGLGSFAGKSVGDAFAFGNIEWHNILFVADDASRDVHLLLDRRAVICDFIRPAYGSPPTDRDAPPQPTKADYFLVGIAESDTNGDRFINGEDAVVLHHCDLAGRRLTPLTPAGAQFVNVAAARPDRLYLRVRRDTDRNGEFDERDATTLLRVDPRRAGQGEEFVPGEVLRRAGEIVTR